ncbi:CMRF35-like molecule 1 isoform X1 [Carassius auratus]|uniref:CMRF35-like molecule 1 isoform X1 n=1 Tax=Carassius auratus TaxID=7957 RepID=A0A6P6KHV6_CARAU|nr:CMRF35-like molecule 1 isoform X1 [Carassius auratus]XP_026071899.1 CMRF35-like molecule 1 isoform X1 [Carassius auratus]
MVYTLTMKIFYNFVIWICLSGIGILATGETEIHGHSGETVTITCSHSRASTNIKYFCRDPCKDSTDILVKSDQSPAGRYRLKDSGNTFTVNITDLQESDSGIYWCGVERFGLDTYTEVKLTVSKDSDTNRTTTPKPEGSSQSFTTRSSFSTSSSSGDITASSSSTGFKVPVLSLRPTFDENGAQTSLSSGPLMFAAVGLTVIFIIFGAVLCIWNNQKKNSHSSKVDAEIQGTTHTSETTGEYEEITETHQRTETHTAVTIYSTVNKTPAANQIQDPPLYSTLFI